MEREVYPGIFRRLKSNAHIRSLISPLRLNHQSFILPLFVEEGLDHPRAVQFMPNIYVQTQETSMAHIEAALEKGVSKFLLFPVPANKSEIPSDFTFAQQIISELKKSFGDSIWLASDVCLCSYTSHGHCGVMNPNYTVVLNEESVEILSRYSLLLAQAGIDCIAPSDMMDGRIKSIRKMLDTHQYSHIPIMSYSAKFSSQWYGPFRDACHSSPQGTSLKDRRTYQLSPNNALEAVQCALRDEQEGADILMVKPASNYTDILFRIKQNTHKPLAAFHVSGEYAAIEQMSELGALDRAKTHLELWSSLQRSGADIIISYAANHAKEWISNYEY